MNYRAQQARELADCIKMDIIESTLSTTISNHHQVLKQVNWEDSKAEIFNDEG